MYERLTAAQLHARLTAFAGDLLPAERLTLASCQEVIDRIDRIRALAAQKGSVIAAHYYVPPEVQEVADLVGDSLGLSLQIRDLGARRVDFQSVYFMGETAKIVAPETRVFVPDTPDVLGCSLVGGTDEAWIRRWKEKNPGGILVVYVNSLARVKALCDYVCTSRNGPEVLMAALNENPGKRVLVLPDQHLGGVMMAKAIQKGADPDRIELYTHPFRQYNAACHVHDGIGQDAAERMLDEHPDAELLIHPECGCAASCMRKLQAGIIPKERAYMSSTQGMIKRARESAATTFLVATETGMLYSMRRAVPGKTFIPVSPTATCKYMKANGLEKLERSLTEDRLEIVLCDDGCDPEDPYRDDRVLHLPRRIAERALLPVQRMQAIAA